MSRPILALPSTSARLSSHTPRFPQYTDNLLLAEPATLHSSVSLPVTDPTSIRGCFRGAASPAKVQKQPGNNYAMRWNTSLSDFGPWQRRVVA
jgi:hypothetical protein